MARDVLFGNRSSTPGTLRGLIVILPCLFSRITGHPQVLSDSVTREELTEKQAIEIVENALFHNANRIYNLGLEPKTDLL